MMFFFCLLQDVHGGLHDTQDAAKAHARAQIYKRNNSDIELKSVENVNLGEPKEEALGKWLVPFGDGFMRWKYMGNTQEVKVRKTRIYGCCVMNKC